MGELIAIQLHHRIRFVGLLLRELDRVYVYVTFILVYIIFLFLCFYKDTIFFLNQGIYF